MGVMEGSESESDLGSVKEKVNQAQVKRRESGKASNCKHQSASDKHGHQVGHIARRACGGVERNVR